MSSMSAETSAAGFACPETLWAPPEIAEHLFDPFVSSKRDGRGLGLALVEKLVADQGGLVEYAREGHPERTVFRLLLPRAPRK